MRSARATRCWPMRRWRCSRPSNSVIASVLGSLAAAVECEHEGNVPVRPKDVRRQAASLRAAHELSNESATQRKLAMRVVVVGYGVQGKKRRRVAGGDVRRRRSIRWPPRPTGATSQRCRSTATTRLWSARRTSRRSKSSTYLLGHGKHVLVEKPLHAATRGRARRDSRPWRAKTGAVCYTAYNHRFEPHYRAHARPDQIRRARRDLSLPHVLRQRHRAAGARLGVARPRRRRAAGSRARICSIPRASGSATSARISVWSRSSRFENRAPDHVVFAAQTRRPQLELEMTLLSWRNHFTCDVLGREAAPRISNRCANGARPPSCIARRVLPSGRPPEAVDHPGAGRSDLGSSNTIISSGSSRDMARDRSRQ